MSSKQPTSSWAKPPPSNLSTLARTKGMISLLIEPWIFMSASLYYLPGTIFDLLSARDFATLLSWDGLQTKWFGRFWTWAGPMVRRTGEARVVPLLEGRVANGVVTDTPVKPGIHGVVLEVGAGSGMWVELFRDDYHIKSDNKARGEDEAATTASDIASAATDGVVRRSDGGEVLGRSRVTKVYGVEPNPQSHAALSEKVKEAGLEDVYEVVPVGIEHIGSGHWKWEKKIEKEGVDCIASILCLCSIPDPEDNIRDLYKYLKPGGRWYVYEHVCCFKDASLGMKLYQRFINLFWPQVMGGCELTRDTAQYLRDAGSWTEFDIAQPAGEAWYHSVPHLYGVLVK